MQLLYYNLIGVFIVQLSPPFPPRISAIKAGESPMEFVSEAYVAFRTAMQIPEELRAKLELLYKFYGGPPS